MKIWTVQRYQIVFDELSDFLSILGLHTPLSTDFVDNFLIRSNKFAFLSNDRLIRLRYAILLTQSVGWVPGLKLRSYFQNFKNLCNLFFLILH